MTGLDYALRYARKGWPILPLHSMEGGQCSCRTECDRPAKHPRSRHGLADATTDEDVITRWWRQWPRANLGLLCGPRAGVWVLDIDPRHGGDLALDALQEQYAALEPTLTAATGGGGRHLVFRIPAGEVGPRNKVWLRGADGVRIPGLDVRGGDAGYVVLAPSVHASGGTYQWISAKGQGPELAPDWLWSLVCPPEAKAYRPVTAAGSSSDRARRWAVGSLLGAARDVATNKVNRNNLLNLKTFKLAGLVPKYLSEDEIRTEMEQAGLAAGDPPHLTATEVRRTIASALRAGMGKTWEPNLPERVTATEVLAWLEETGGSLAGAADVFGVPSATIRSWLHRARGRVAVERNAPEQDVSESATHPRCTPAEDACVAPSGTATHPRVAGSCESEERNAPEQDVSESATRSSVERNAPEQDVSESATRSSVERNAPALQSEDVQRVALHAARRALLDVLVARELELEAADPMRVLREVRAAVANVTSKAGKLAAIARLYAPEWLDTMARARLVDPLIGAGILAELRGERGASSMIDEVKEAIGERKKSVEVLRDGRPPPPDEPRPTGGGDGRPDRPRLYVSTNVLDTANETLPHLIRGGRVFQRGKKLVLVSRDGRAVRGVWTPTQAPTIEVFDAPGLINEVSRMVDTWRVTVNPQGEASEKPVICPRWLAESVLALPAYPFPLLQGLTQIPIFTPGGHIRLEAGYDEETGYLYEPPPGLRVTVPSRIGSSGVEAAVEALLEPFVDFPFAAEHHRAALVACLLTMVARPGIPGTCPLFVFTATTPKSGKTLLVDLLVEIAQGRPASRMTYTDNEEEMDKRIFATLMAGHASVLIDNVNGPFGGQSLDALFTAWPDFEGRELGFSRMHRVPARAVWCMTGNNPQFIGDLTQRIIPIHLEPDVERPELRSGFKHPRVHQLVRQHRELLLSASFSLLQAYIDARRPDMGLGTFGGFGEWSDLIRNLLVWAGLADPYDGVAALSEHADEARAQVGGLLSAWYATWGSEPVFLSTFHDRVNREKTPELYEAVLPYIGKDGKISTHHLGQVLKKAGHRIYGGFKPVKTESQRHGVRAWKVIRVGAEREVPV